MRFAFLTAAQYNTLPDHVPNGYHLEERTLRTETEKLLAHLSLYYTPIIEEMERRINDLKKQDERRNRLSGNLKPGTIAFLQRLEHDDADAYQDIYPGIHYSKAITFLGDICGPLMLPASSVYNQVVPSFGKALAAQSGMHNDDAAVIMDLHKAAEIANIGGRDFMLAVASDRPEDRFDTKRHTLNATAFICAYSKALLEIHVGQLAAAYNSDSAIFMDLRLCLQHVYSSINEYARDAQEPILMPQERPPAQVLEFKQRPA